MNLALLITPLARGAYFTETPAVAEAELRTVVGESPIEFRRIGGLDLLVFDAPPDHYGAIARLSVTQGLFRLLGDSLRPLDAAADFVLPEDLVSGDKYQGKTHELVTQLAINVGLAQLEAPAKTLLDPMAGRGTTLLWALRYGLDARGIERDANALEAFHRHVKKQTKLHRLKHVRRAGFVGTKNKDGVGKFERFDFGTNSLQLIAGDTRDAESLLARQRFDLLVTDLPYGVRFKGRQQRSALDILRETAQTWSERLRDGGAMVLIFNTYQPKPAELLELFEAQGLVHRVFSAPHRMSESIVRDLLVFQKPA